MTELLNILLTMLLNYGYPVVFMCIIFAYLGLPIPTNAILLAAGAFSVDGTLNIFILIPAVAFIAIIGDVLGYYLGHKFGYLLVNRFTSKIGITNESLKDVEVYLANWGRWSVFLTRWLITPIGIPINLVAGITHFSFRKFLAIVILGELLWSFIYLYTGYFFGSNWISIWNLISDAPQILALFVIGVSLLIYITKRLRH